MAMGDIIIDSYKKNTPNAGLGNLLCAYIYINDIVKWISPFSTWDPNKWRDTDSYVRYWKDPNKKILQKHYIQSNIKDDHVEKLPIIHFRCSDVPFIKFDDYRLPKKEVGAEIIKILKEKGYNEVIWLSNTGHKSLECSKDACKEYSNYYKSLLKGITIKELPEGDVNHDFMLMHHSPLVISLVNSSFSMMAKVRDLDNYKVVNSSHSNNEFTNVPWIINNVRLLDHKEVETYCDSANVIKLLS